MTTLHSRDETNLKPTRILVVEDEGIIARDITAMLQRLGYEVIGQAGTGVDAIELASTHATDLVLMDIKIRGPIDGVQTADEIRRRIGVPIVFLSAHADSETLERATASEPFGYVVKPFSESDLRVAIEVGLNRHRLQEQSDVKQVWFRSALESIKEAVLATDSEGVLTFFNSAAELLTGWTSTEATGRRLSEVLDCDGKKELLDLNKLSSDEPVFLTNAKVRRKTGEATAVLGSFRPMRDPGSRVVQGAVLTIRPVPDLDDSVRSIQGTDLLASSAMQLQELSYALSNDLREPVRNISCFAELLGRNGSPLLDDTSREYLDFIIKGSRRIESQMGSLRSFHLAGTVSSDTSLCADATGICHTALQTLANEIAEAGAEITLLPLPAVAMDPRAFRDLIHQLLLNALRFRAERTPCIRIGALRDETFWKFTVEDNGLGFDVQQAERIFGLFTKAHEPQRCGNGVGLAICRRLVEAAGGRIWAESLIGEWSRFHFMLPALSLSNVTA